MRFGVIKLHPYHRALARVLADYVDKKIYSTGRMVWGTKCEVQDAAKKELIEVALIPFYSWFYALEVCGNLCMVKECPRVVGWAKRCMQREASGLSEAVCFRSFIGLHPYNDFVSTMI
ncbi:hypothetical protein ACFX19_004258 [Malus domestica]